MSSVDFEDDLDGFLPSGDEEECEPGTLRVKGPNWDEEMVLARAKSFSGDTVSFVNVPRDAPRLLEVLQELGSKVKSFQLENRGIRPRNRWTNEEATMACLCLSSVEDLRLFDSHLTDLTPFVSVSATLKRLTVIRCLLGESSLRLNDGLANVIASEKLEELELACNPLLSSSLGELLLKVPLFFGRMR